MRDLSPEQIQVLQLIQSYGLDAVLTDKEERLRDRLESNGLIYLMGDSYDANYYLTEAGKTALAKLDPQWWVNQRTAKEGHIRHLEYELNPIAVASLFALIETNLDRRIAEAKATAEQERRQRRSWVEQTTAQLEQEKRELQEWLEANQDRFLLTNKSNTIKE